LLLKHAKFVIVCVKCLNKWVFLCYVAQNKFILILKLKLLQACSALL
jgi:hypothetical protein